MMPFRRIAILGLGLIGSSLARAVRARLPDVALVGFDRDPAVVTRVAELGLVDILSPSAAAAARGAELVVLATPLGTFAELAQAIAPALEPDAVVSDVGSAKQAVIEAVAPCLPAHAHLVPAHPVAGTEQSGPDAGFEDLFQGRWAILTPPPGTPPMAVERVRRLWEAVGATVEVMDARHHDLVLAITSHLPHLIAYSIVGTASDLESVTKAEVIKYSAGGFRDFTRIAASDPTMWRDVFLMNREAVLEMLARFSEDLAALQRAIRWGDGETLFRRFAASRAIRRAIVEAGQDTAAPDFGRRR
ncbi:MAG: prephenate/arogenate dehydrogenase family protein [Sphingomonadaceae bacterium]|uniref:prephenate/arogenate dehydrogenase family protein n=1 Tax=Thermaurantiacus sp. TaxID=2820283 RepID=UPI00298ED765|nr:prephenate/arogenate dehydrogenase family protein [Thermaurantiacus sp.]MCS6986644.1 prephenate/arogenate dehydrogenase family protein [Sphingomonadaceae bacterium]MDW8414094.1 prephenate/arogenate dehydrogenase family protein [Thermaurantiacus sp.]